MTDRDDEPEFESMNKATKRRKRRRAKAKLAFGASAVRAHREQTGRTGQIWEKRSHGKASRYAHVHPNPPWQMRVDRA